MEFLDKLEEKQTKSEFGQKSIKKVEMVESNNQDGDGGNQAGGNNDHIWAAIGKGTVAVGVGVTVGLALPGLVFGALGLSAAGPVAGGWFAGASGAAIAKGSTMAFIQSAAMGGQAAVVVGTQVAAGAAAA